MTEEHSKSMASSVFRISLLISLVCASAPASAQVFFEDTFESGDLRTTQNGFRWGDSTAATVSAERAKSGGRSLKLNFAAVPRGEDSFAEQRFELGRNYPDLWVRYDLYVPSNYTHRSDPPSSNNKGFLYVWSGDYGRPDGPGMGPNLWPNSDGTSNASHYVWGPGLDRHYYEMPKAIEAADRGKWVRIVVHYKYASPTNNDGIAEIWKTRDGVTEKILNIRNGAWYVPGQSGFNRGYLLGWANSGFTEQTVFYIDNIAFSTQSLLGGDEPTQPTPSPPAGLSVR